MRQKTEGDEVIYLVIPPFLQQRVLKQCVIAMHLHLCPIIIGLQATVTGSQMKGVQVCVILSIFISTTYLFVSCLNRVCLELCLDWQLVITVVVSDRQRIFSLTNTFRESGSRISFWWMLKRKYRLVNLNKWAEYHNKWCFHTEELWVWLAGGETSSDKTCVLIPFYILPVYSILYTNYLG